MTASFGTLMDQVGELLEHDDDGMPWFDFCALTTSLQEQVLELARVASTQLTLKPIKMYSAQLDSGDNLTLKSCI